MIKAAIDIGTNTTHIIIGEVSDGILDKIIYRKRFYTYIAADGIDKISAKAIDRLMKALEHFHIKVNEYKVAISLCVATEALRSASNGYKIIEKVKNKFGFEITIISGIEEANLIYQGVSQIVDLNSQSSLIIDIGGGSVEFISVQNGQLQSVDSFPIGIARLYAKFHQSEPISIDNISHLNNHIGVYINPILHHARQHKSRLIGSAGTFEVITPSLGSKNVAILERTEFEKYYSQVIHLSLTERLNSPLVPEKRAKYIVVALILVKYLFETVESDSIVVSSYSLKEGLITSSSF